MDNRSERQKKKINGTDWMNDGSIIKLIFVEDGDTELRIAFEPDGLWSYIGRVELEIPENKLDHELWLAKTRYSRTCKLEGCAT